jgi:hypothetical protein
MSGAMGRSTNATIPVALSVLTWKAPDTLARTLPSLAPIATLFSERIVVCQESDPREIGIAREHGFTPIMLRENVGIQRGLAKCVEAPASDIVLVLENDCPFLGSGNDTGRILDAISLVRGGKAHVVQMSLQEAPRGRYTRYWRLTDPPRRNLRGLLLRSDADAVSSDAVFATPPAIPLGVEAISPGLYLTSSAKRPWANRPFLTTKEFFLGELIAFAEANPTSRSVNGKPDLEHAISSRHNRWWWRERGFSVGFMHPGLFGHQREDRPSTDEKGRQLATEPA